MPVAFGRRLAKSQRTVDQSAVGNRLGGYNEYNVGNESNFFSPLISVVPIA